MISHPLRLAALTLAVVTLGVALVARDRGPGKGCSGDCSGPGAGPGFHRGGMEGFRGLNLSEAQKTQLKALHERHQKTLEAKRDAALAAGKALHEALAKTSTDVATLRSLNDKAAAARLDLLLEHRALRQEVLPLLTAEQKAKFEQMPMGMMGMGPGMNPGMMQGKGHGRMPGMGWGPKGHHPQDCPQDCPKAAPEKPSK
jgi:Spy/CpxP family protein refolding chaperone